MIRKFGLRELFLLLVTAVILVAVYVIDGWLYRLQLEGASNFNIEPAIWAGTLANIFLAGVMILLGWYVLYVLTGRKNLLIALLFVLVGAVLAFNPILRFIYSSSFLPSRAVAFYGPKSLFVITGAFLMVIGLLMFILNRRNG
jgi:hypothetical protein